MQKILLPVDGSAHALQAAHTLIDLAGKHGPVEIHVLNVEPPPLAWQTHGMTPEVIREHLDAHARASMESALDALARAGIPHQAHVRMGKTAETIVAAADELGCDAIAMGTRGLGAVSGLALGSVTAKVLHLTRLPVLCVKSPAKAKSRTG